jgi:predicted dehydrogenase
VETIAMPALADLHRAVRTTLAGKRLGRPVFVRYTLQGPEQPPAVAPRLAQLTAVVRDWLGQPLERVYAVGSADGGQVALTLQFRDGATAVISFARGRPQGPGADVLVLGNHGALYHDAGSANPWEEAGELPARPDPQLQAVVERALRSGKPEPLSGGPVP